MLTGVVDPLESALKDLSKAKAYKGLDGRVTAAAEAAARATARLGEVAPPAELAGEHPRLIAALQQFHTTLGSLSSKVSDQELCTGRALRVGLGDAEGTSALRDAMAAVDTRLPGDRLALTLPSAGQKTGSRPANGKFIRPGNRGGRGSITIDNGSSTDAVVSLSRGRKSAISVYVREGKKYTVNGVTDGRYTVFFAGGTDWDDKVRAFGHDCAFQRFEESLNFRTVRTATQIRWSTWEITLQPVIGGTASITDVDPNDFPD